MGNVGGPRWRRDQHGLQLLLHVLLLQLLLLILIPHHASAQSQPTQTQMQPQLTQDNTVSFRPSIAIVIGIFSIMFSLTFLLLMYAKFCHSGSATGLYGAPPQSFLYDLEVAGVADDATTGPGSRFSGIDKTVIESLPFFRFSSLRGARDGLECAVCLSRFDGAEVLRLLPRCKHAFHIDCVDRWLEAHSSCPLCRCRVRIEDVTLFKYSTSSRFLFRGNPAETEDIEMQLELYIEREPDDDEREEERDGGDTDVGDTHRKPAAGGGGGASSASLRFGAIGESFRKHLDVLKVGVTGGGPRKSKTSTATTLKGDRPPLLANMAQVEPPPHPAAHPDPQQQQQQPIMHKFRHRIIVSDVVFKNRWSDLNSADLTSLNCDMLSTVSSGRFNPPPALTEQPTGGAKGTDKGTSTANYDSGSSNNNSNSSRAIATAALTIKEEMERKRTLESKAGEMIGSSAAAGTHIDDGSTSHPIDPNTDTTTSTTIDRASSPLIITEKQKCMSEITDVPRRVLPSTLLATGGERYGSTNYASHADAGTSKEEKVRRVWIPIARRTVQWLAGRERIRSSQQHVPDAP